MDTLGIEPNTSRKQMLSERDNQLHHVPYINTCRIIVLANRRYTSDLANLLSTNFSTPIRFRSIKDGKFISRRKIHLGEVTIIRQWQIEPPGG